MTSTSDSRPFFSVGVTTYKRPTFLEDCVRSILAQSFSDFEVVIGNNDPNQAVGPFDDDRIAVINRPRNLGQIGNMNALLREARGRYFTWLADDDLYDPGYLESVSDALVTHRYPLCVFTGYQFAERLSPSGSGQASELVEGKVFTERFLSRELRVLGCYGVWSRTLLVSLGGMRAHADSSLYSDHSLALKGSLLPHVAIVPAKLVLFRRHQGSYSYSGVRPRQLFDSQQSFLEVGEETIKETIKGRTASRLHANLVRWCVKDGFGLILRSDGGRVGQAIPFGGRMLICSLRLVWPDLILSAAVGVVLRFVFLLLKIAAGDRNDLEGQPGV